MLSRKAAAMLCAAGSISSSLKGTTSITRPWATLCRRVYRPNGAASTRADVTLRTEEHSSSCDRRLTTSRPAQANGTSIKPCQCVSAVCSNACARVDFREVTRITSFSVGPDGVLTASFSNGATLALARSHSRPSTILMISRILETMRMSKRLSLALLKFPLPVRPTMGCCKAVRLKTQFCVCAKPCTW